MGGTLRSIAGAPCREKNIVSKQERLPIDVSPPGKSRWEGTLPSQTEVSQADGGRTPFVKGLYPVVKTNERGVFSDFRFLRFHLTHRSGVLY
jgi:hypothetical protein